MNSGVPTQEESVVSESCSISRSDPKAPTTSLDSVTCLCTDICCSSAACSAYKHNYYIKDLAKIGRNFVLAWFKQYP